MSSSDTLLVGSQLEQVLKLKYCSLGSDYLILLKVHAKKIIARIDIKLNSQFKDNPFRFYM